MLASSGVGLIVLSLLGASPAGGGPVAAPRAGVDVDVPSPPRPAALPSAPPPAANGEEPPPPPSPAAPPREPGTGGDAEPAPTTPGSPPAVPRAGGGASSDSGPRAGRHRIAISPRFAYRLGDAGDTVKPAAGYGIAGTFDFTYARPDEVMDLAVGVDFSSDRFAIGEQGMTAQAGVPATFASTRVISDNNFVVTHTVAFRVDPVRPFFALGAGVGVGYFDSVATEYRPGYERDTHLLGRASMGLDILVTEVWGVTVRGDYTFVRRAAPFVTEGGQSLPLFGDLLDVNLGGVYRF